MGTSHLEVPPGAGPIRVRVYAWTRAMLEWGRSCAGDGEAPSFDGVSVVQRAYGCGA